MALLVAGAVPAWDAIEGDGSRPAIAVGLVVVLVGSWWLSPLHRGRHVPHARAQAESGDDDFVVYWKPGCTYCIRLLATLRRSERDQIRWVNVWQDADAAQFVADHNDGNVLTPTVMTGPAASRWITRCDATAQHATSRRLTGHLCTWDCPLCS